jgi:hypothetical protein
LGSLRPAWHSRVDNYKGRTLDILHTLQMGRRLEALDPRDKIYALLGISTGIGLEDPLITVDYRKSHREVYLDFARYSIESSNSYDILSYLYENNLASHGEPLNILPSWVPNWEGSPSSRITRTILGTLEPKKVEESPGRQLLVKNSHIWLNPKTLVITEGYVIGDVADYGLDVLLQGQNERAFQDLRDLYKDDHATLYKEIMNLWIGGLFQISQFEPRQGKRRDYPHRVLQGKASDFSCLISMNPDVPKDSVEYHMFTRARKTATWKDDENKAVDWVIDKSSILDWKRIGLCASSTKTLGISSKDQEEDRLMILPPQARFGDLVVYFRGARVPFVVRRSESPCPLAREIQQMEVKQKLEELGVDCSSYDLEQCTIIGECLVNGFGDLVKDEVTTTSEENWSPLKKLFEKGLKTMFVLS